jgi:hypothetical protein
MHDAEVFSDRVIECYDKLSSWEQGVVRSGSITLQQTHIPEVLGRFAPLRWLVPANVIDVQSAFRSAEISN